MGKNGNGNGSKGPELHREVRLQAVASMICNGYRLHQIASALCDKYKVTYATIKSDIKAIRIRWHDEGVNGPTLSERREEVLTRFLETRRMAMQGFVDTTKRPATRFRSLRLVHDIDKDIANIYGVKALDELGDMDTSSFTFNIDLKPSGPAGDEDVDSGKPGTE